MTSVCCSLDMNSKQLLNPLSTEYAPDTDIFNCTVGVFLKNCCNFINHAFSMIGNWSI